MPARKKAAHKPAEKTRLQPTRNRVKVTAAQQAAQKTAKKAFVLNSAALGQIPVQATLSGLALARQTFGPLFPVVPASEDAWNNYVANRSSTLREFAVNPDRSPKGPNDDVIKHEVAKRVCELESEMGVAPPGVFRKCVIVLDEKYELVGEGDSFRSAEILSRIYSPASPAYIDVHFEYYSGPSAESPGSVKWQYALGFKVTHDVTLSPANLSALKGEVGDWDGVRTSSMHRSNGWRSICWAFYDNSHKSNVERQPGQTSVEHGLVDITPNDVIDVCQLLFGRTEQPAVNASAAEQLHYRRKLVWGVRMLLASVGIAYRIACVVSEADLSPHFYGPGVIPWFLQSVTTDFWVARGVRRACGFWLPRDPVEDTLNEERRRREERSTWAANALKDSETKERELHELYYKGFMDASPGVRLGSSDSTKSEPLCQVTSIQHAERRIALPSLRSLHLDGLEGTFVFDLLDSFASQPVLTTIAHTDLCSPTFARRSTGGGPMIIDINAYDGEGLIRASHTLGGSMLSVGQCLGVGDVAFLRLGGGTRSFSAIHISDCQLSTEVLDWLLEERMTFSSMPQMEIVHAVRSDVARFQQAA
ncbi:hypothetical protein CONPUDRAFT_168417 [Coniophora puteana RWD-64-598 SS2]|uniref:Uncharacterized protein n=1 Tax=Coniophora puteana (strain RWD-64-598) TaxID=741705 RepID=A0A5M3MC07_CONPW|nr:uncharacterized protein CONPUDRAFT_168417 [Coniophora puteana RWD-64-598 SS2]EIW76577.1 hypothetical protein CONPUDRAFT_168417 [Coniophora puteana RWD-64-598 SS2]